MNFSIITPSYNMLQYLKLCHNSIVDQAVDLEHIVIDNESSDGTADWIKRNSNIKYKIGKDTGMYDALNTGINLSKNQIIGYLNCDEQYLPGTLRTVKDFFIKNPNVDILFGDKINIYPDGKFNSFKKTLRESKYYILASNLYIPSCSLFFKRDVFDGMSFNINFKTCGDAEFILRSIQSNKKFYYYKKYFSTFTIRKNNLSQTDLAQKERKKLINEFTLLPLFILRFILFFKTIEKILNKSFQQKFPLQYDIFILSKLNSRTRFIVNSGSFKTIWKGLN